MENHAHPAESRHFGSDKPKVKSAARLMLFGIPTTVFFLFFIYMSAIYLPRNIQLWLGWLFILLIVVVNRYLSRSADFQRIVIILICLFLTSRYWFFRVNHTIYYLGIFDFIGMIALFMAESYGILTYLLGMFVNIAPLKRELDPIQLDDPDLPTVDIFIPTYNESELMVGITATAASKVDYPKDKLNVFILDDGGTLQKRNDPDPEKAEAARARHENLKNLAEFLEIHYITRDLNLHAKAGNITHALFTTCPEEAMVCVLRQSSMDMGLSGSCGDLVLILDCDHVPTRDFLRNTVRYFMEDERLFLVQTPHFFINPDPVEKNLSMYLEKPSENEMFYGAVHLGLDFWNASFFCGSAAILRRKYLEEIGGIAGDTITEDAETALTLHSRGYNSVFVSRPMVCGLSPETFSDFILQRSRWAQGMTQILILKNPLLIKGLSPAQRVCYMNSCIFWLFGLSRFTFFAAPLLFLFFGLNVYNASLGQVLAYAGPHILGAMMLTDYMFGELRHPFFSELYEVVQSVFNVPAVISTIFRPKKPSFKVTPKDQSLSADTLSPLAIPFYIMLILALAAYPVALYRLVMFPFMSDAVYITLFWNSFNLMLVLLCLGAVWEKRQIRRRHRIRTDEDIWVGTVDGQENHPGRVFDLSEDGIGFTAANNDELKKGREIRIKGVDSYGHEYNLPARIARVVPGKSSLICGCEFLGQDGLSWMEIVTYVYGDSRRWEEFWKRRRQHRKNAWRGIGYLLVKGIDGSVRNFSGLLLLTFKRSATFGGHLWRRRKSGAT